MEHADQVLQAHSGKFLGYLVRICGDFNVAEDVHQDVMLSALTNWRKQGVPEKPLAWLLTTARNRAIDHFRAHQREDRILGQLDSPDSDSDEHLDQLLEDDFLRLMFTCCHPSLGEEVRVALTLKSVVGLTVDEVARAFVVSPRTMEQRLVRAKRKIRMAGIAYEIPEHEQLDRRLGSVLQTLYLMFTEGYAATSGDRLVREELCSEAIRLAGLVSVLYPEQAELLGLRALMILQDSRRDARTSKEGVLIPLDRQDRTKWDLEAITLGKAMLDHALALKQRPGPYQIQAAIAALHTDVGIDANWAEISLLYEALIRMDDSAVVKLNYAVALMMNYRIDEAKVVLGNVREVLSQYFPYWCAQAHLNSCLGNLAQAQQDYDCALRLTASSAERSYVLEARRKLATSH